MRRLEFLRIDPRPEHDGHGSFMMRPEPPQTLHGFMLTTLPNGVSCA